jgi:hypothetical protein
VNVKGLPPPTWVLYFCLIVALVPALTAPAPSRVIVAIGGLITSALLTGLYTLWWRSRLRRR